MVSVGLMAQHGIGQQGQQLASCWEHKGLCCIMGYAISNLRQRLELEGQIQHSCNVSCFGKSQTSWHYIRCKLSWSFDLCEQSKWGDWSMGGCHWSLPSGSSPFYLCFQPIVSKLMWLTRYQLDTKYCSWFSKLCNISMSSYYEFSIDLCKAGQVQAQRSWLPYWMHDLTLPDPLSSVKTLMVLLVSVPQMDLKKAWLALDGVQQAYSSSMQN